MRLYEYQAKSLLAQFDIPVAPGKLAKTAQEIADAVEEFNSPIILKPQLLSQNNQKNTHAAQTLEIAQEYAINILAKPIGNEVVQSILIEAAASATLEIYIAIVNDDELNKPVMRVAERNHSKLDHFIHEPIDPFIGFLRYQARDLAGNLNIPFEYWDSFTKIAQDLFRCYVSIDALVIEINPLIITDQNDFLALDVSISVDDNALYRQPQLADLVNDDSIKGSLAGKNYYRDAGGTIACVVNGSGVGMTIMDIFSGYDDAAQLSSFIEMGEEGTADQLETALNLILNDTNTKTALINVFGGMTPCEDLAQTIVQTVQDTKTEIPIITRMTGEGAQEGQKVIEASQLTNLCNVFTLTEAVQKVITASNTG